MSYMFTHLNIQEILNNAEYGKENYADRGGCYATRSKAEYREDSLRELHILISYKSISLFSWYYF